MYTVYIKRYGSNTIHPLCSNVTLTVAMELLHVYKIAHPGDFAFVS